jgi:hypothetical protein
MNRLAVRADGRDLPGVQFCLAQQSQRRLGKMFTEDEIEFANLRDSSVQADVKDLPAQSFGE